MVASIFRVRMVISALRRSQPIAASRARFDAVITMMSAIRASVASSAPALTHNARQVEGPPSPGPVSDATSAICGIYGSARGVGSMGTGIRRPLRLGLSHLTLLMRIVDAHRGAQMRFAQPPAGRLPVGAAQITP